MDNLDQETLRRNEMDANKNIAKGSFVLASLLIIVWIFYLVGLFTVNASTMLRVNISFPIFIVLLNLTIVYSRTKLVEKSGFKYYLILQFVIIIFVLNVLLPKHALLGYAAALILVAHYYNPKVAIFTYITVIVLMFFGIYLGMLYGEWDSNLLNGVGQINIDGVVVNCADTTLEQRIRWLDILRANGDNRYFRAFLFYFFPRTLALTLIGAIAYFLTGRSARLLKHEAEQATINARLAGELDVARNIQHSVLPRSLSNQSVQEDVAALMDPAKEVGGDFYDYFNIDATHIALVIADVSGKGVPGALFMMKTETLIKSLTQSLKENTANIIERANFALCQHNDADMFVTCWLGILDLVSGELKYTNAGHNDPLLVSGDKVSYFHDRHDLVLGAIENAHYNERSITLKKGDKIILYTDGVTEAHNMDNELFGEKRLLEFTIGKIEERPDNFISSLRSELSEFAGGKEQFDDITMLVFEYSRGAEIMESRVFRADKSELNNLFDYSSTLLNILNFTRRQIIMINTALEEVFVNVASYAYDSDGLVEVSLSNDKNNVTFVFKDAGKPFNPLLKKDPDITADSDEREIGGLGIYLVKKIMDDVSYKYEDGRNVLTLVKRRNTF